MGTYFDSTKGNVHSGDTVQAPNEDCNKGVNDTSPLVNAFAPGKTGDYLVTATSNIDTAIFTPNDNGSLAQKGATFMGCRPDLINEVNSLPAAQHSTTFQPPNSPHQFHGIKNMVMDAPNDTHLGSPGQDTRIDYRTTLHVHGDLHIDGNVVAGPATADSPSFGVIVDGNIYIAPSVSHLFGYYYTAGDIGHGTVFTCATDATHNFDATPPTLQAQDCMTPLTIQGLLMARVIHFARSVPAQNGPSEHLDYTGQVYAAAPPGFSSLFTGFGPPNALQLLPPKY